MTDEEEGLPGSDPFFIIGSQRSGTTLMRLILDSHIDVTCIDEAYSFRVLTQGVAGFTGLVGFKTPQLTEQFAGPWLRDDAAIRAKSPSGVVNCYLKHRFIFMVRDVRDVVVSMLSRPGWLRTYGATVLAAKAETDDDFRIRYREELCALAESGCSDAATAALIWCYKTDALKTYVERGMSVLPVKYEHLVTSPATELSSICRFLHIPWDAALLRHHRVRHSDVRGPAATGGTDCGRPIDAMSIGKWRLLLSAEQLRVIEVIAGCTRASLEELCGGRSREGLGDAAG